MDNYNHIVKEINICQCLYQFQQWWVKHVFILASLTFKIASRTLSIPWVTILEWLILFYSLSLTLSNLWQNWFTATLITVGSILVTSSVHAMHIEQMMHLWHRTYDTFKSWCPNKSLPRNHGVVGFWYFVRVVKYMASLVFMVTNVQPVDYLLNLVPHLVEWRWEWQVSLTNLKVVKVAHVIVTQNDIFPFTFRYTF